jgi:hypothetical protein
VSAVGGDVLGRGLDVTGVSTFASQIAVASVVYLDNEVSISGFSQHRIVVTALTVRAERDEAVLALDLSANSQPAIPLFNEPVTAISPVLTVTSLGSSHNLTSFGSMSDSSFCFCIWSCLR